MAPVLCFATPREMHHENTSTGHIGDHHFSVFLLLDHDRYEHHVRVGCCPASALSGEEGRSARLPRVTIHAIR